MVADRENCVDRDLSSQDSLGLDEESKNESKTSRRDSSMVR